MPPHLVLRARAASSAAQIAAMPSTTRGVARDTTSPGTPTTLPSRTAGRPGQSRQREAGSAAAIVLLSQPADYPHALVQALQSLLAEWPAVNAAYLAQMHRPASGEPSRDRDTGPNW